MKRFLCALTAFALLLVSGASCRAEALGDEPNMRFFESRFGYTLWYSADQLSSWTEDWEGSPAECFCPWEDQSGVAALICRGSRYSARLWEGCAPVSLGDTGVFPDYPFEVTAYTDGDVVTEQWIVSAADGDFVFILQYEEGDPMGWGSLLRQILETLKFPYQPAENASFRLDFFQGGAAGMRFIDVVADAEADPLVLMPLTEIHNFSLDFLTWHTSGGGAEWHYDAAPLYTADVLSPGDNLRIYCFIPATNLRIVYTDANGENCCFLISQTASDGSLLFLEDDL